MINNIFKGKIDIHGGGNDLKFPHHDNEIAQSLCLHNHMIANYWIHNGRVDLSGQKMSKSLGNVIWAHELLETIPVQVYRLMMLNVPYIQLFNYKEEVVSQATTDYEKIKRAYVGLFRKLELSDNLIDLSEKKETYNNSEIAGLVNEFKEHMGNDFNTANAITTIVKTNKLINGYTRNKDVLVSDMQESLKALHDMLWVLGIEPKISVLSEEERKLVNEWNKAKAEKDFEKADKLRDAIKEKI